MSKALFKADASVHGDGSVKIEWESSGGFLASCGSNRRVHIYTRAGELYDEFPLVGTGSLIQMCWDVDGEQLALIQEGRNSVLIWHRHSQRRSELETNLKEPILLLWSRVGPQLAIATSQGNLLMYNSRTKRKTPILGKHPKRIVCGCWSKENLLALGSIDKIVTISDADGATKDQRILKAEPIRMRFSAKKNDGKKTNRETTLSISLSSNTVYMYEIDDNSNTVELTFQSKYGSVVDYHWYGDGYMLAAFSRGYVVVISTHNKEIGEELYCLKVHEETLTAVAVSITGMKFTSCSADCVRVVDMNDWKELKLRGLDSSSLNGSPDTVQWSSDGQILSVGTGAGTVHSFLISLPAVGAGYQGTVAYLSSLQEISVMNNVRDRTITSVPVAMEPSFIAVGDKHVAVGMNNHVRIFRVSDSKMVHQDDYLGTVKLIQLNEEYIAVLSNGTVQLHRIEGESNEDRHVFPERSEYEISDMHLTRDYLIYCTDSGALHQHYVPKACRLLNEFRHRCGLQRVFANQNGSRMIIIDERSSSFVFSPFDNSLICLPKEFPESPTDVLWCMDRLFSFVAVSSVAHPTATIPAPALVVPAAAAAGADATSGSIAYEFIYAPQSIEGATVEFVARTSLPAQMCWLFAQNDELVGLRGQEVLIVPLASTDRLNRPPPERIEQLVSCHRFSDAYALAVSSNSAAVSYINIAEKALYCADVETALLCYRECSEQVSTVLALERLQGVEEMKLLAGHIFLLQGEFDRAEQCFLSSSRPIVALEMRRDLLQWAHALRLAATIAPHLEAEICANNAQQLEFRGKFQDAKNMYERALSHDEISNDERASRSCRSGLCRTMMQLGDVRRGNELAYAIGEQALLLECASILERMKLLNDAADMYIRCGAHEKAAKIYISNKNFQMAAPLMSFITTPKLHSQYAKAKEKNGEYEEAERAYELANDTDSVVRLNLKHLDVAKAFAIVRKTRSTDGASMIAQYCRANRDFESAIEFMILAQLPDEAFKLAQLHNKVEFFVESVGSEGSAEQLLSIAEYFEARKQYERAARFRVRLGEFQRALRLLLLSGEDELVPSAIQVVKEANGRPEYGALLRTLKRFLNGESDGKVKDPRHMLCLFLATNEFEEASNIAAEISREEEMIGNYKAAHDVLLTTCKELRHNAVALPDDMRSSLTLLHSYILVKYLVKNGDHEGAARMLIRVAKNISKFSSHIVPILTSTVIECQRAGLRRSAYEYASMLMRPEYRQHLDNKYKRKIESIVRRRAQDQQQQEEEEPTAPCPYCASEIAGTLLDCPFCKNVIPYCAVSGRHMMLNDWSVCPSCDSPALYSKFVEFVNSHEKCAMCECDLTLADIKRVQQPLKYRTSTGEGRQSKEASPTASESKPLLL